MIKGLFGKLLAFFGILSLGYLIIPKQANAQTFNGINYSKKSIITITHPNGIDTVCALANTYIPRKDGWNWGRTVPSSWNLQPGDTVDIYATDSFGVNEQNTWRNVTGAGGHLVIPLFANKPKNYTIAVRNVTSIDTLAEGRCRVKHNGNYSDWVVDTFNLIPSDHDFAFNLANSDSVWQWTAGGDWDSILNDSVFVEATGIPSGRTGSSKRIIQRYWTDGDQLDDITLGVVVEEENNLENKVNNFKVYPSHGNMFNVKDYRGKVSIYDETGRKVAVSVIQDENSKLNLAYLPRGVYFIKPEDVAGEVEKIVKVE